MRVGFDRSCIEEAYGATTDIQKSTTALIHSRIDIDNLKSLLPGGYQYL